MPMDKSEPTAVDPNQQPVINYPKPSRGRTVFFKTKEGDEEDVAVITRVHADHSVNLRVLTDDSRIPPHYTSVLREDTVTTPTGFRWSWPPRV